jgi:hypothetical protein
MNINSGSLWATPTQSYGSSSVQGQSGASGTAQTDYSTVMQQAGNSLIATLDTDKSGTIDKAEFSQAAQALAEKTGKTYNADTAFSAIDKNSDGSISADELLNALKQAQSQQSHGHHPSKIDATASALQSATDSAQTADSSTQTSLSKMQTALLQRIMAAYTSNSTSSNSTTLATA